MWRAAATKEPLIMMSNVLSALSGGSAAAGANFGYLLLRVNLVPHLVRELGTQATSIFVDRQLHQFTRLENGLEAGPILQNRDILERIAVHRDYVGKASRLQSPDLAAFLQQQSISDRRAAQRLSRRKSQVFDVVLKFARMPFAIGRDREATVRAHHEWHPGLARLAEGFDGGFEFALVSVGESGVAGVGRLREVDIVDDQTQRWNQCASVLD